MYVCVYVTMETTSALVARYKTRTHTRTFELKCQNYIRLGAETMRNEGESELAANAAWVHENSAEVGARLLLCLSFPLS